MSVTGISGSGTGAPAPRTPTTNLGKDDFLRLLAGQLKHQNPMSAKGGEEFMAQMTQFAMLEQLQNLATSQTRATQAAASTQAVGLIGKTVSYADDAGVRQQAAVERVIYDAGAPKLVLAGVERPLGLADVTEVA